jgi:hypothetical protein
MLSSSSRGSSNINNINNINNSQDGRIQTLPALHLLGSSREVRPLRQPAHDMGLRADIKSTHDLH